MTWYCHNCETTAPSLAGARRHAKEAGPVYKAGRMVTHKLTQIAGRCGSVVNRYSTVTTTEAERYETVTKYFPKTLDIGG